MEQLAADQGEEAKMMPNSMIKPLHKIIAEHKDVTKIVIQLNSIITQNKMEAQDVLEIFTKDSHLWDKVDYSSSDVESTIYYLNFFFGGGGRIIYTNLKFC